MHAIDVPVCSIRQGTVLCTVVQETKAIVVDEAPMTDRCAFEAPDRMLTDLMGSIQRIGGVYMLLYDDFRQLCKVIPGANSCLKNFYLWNSVTTMHLHTNMRVHLCGDLLVGAFVKHLLAIGDGKFPIHSKCRCNPITRYNGYLCTQHK